MRRPPAPIVIAGLSDACGSWKTICIRRRMRAQLALAQARDLLGPRSGRCRRSRGTRPRSVRPSVVLPLPDSPTRPSTSPRRRSSETPSTALHRRPPSRPTRRSSEAAADRVERLQVADSRRAARRRRPAAGAASGLVRHGRSPRARAARSPPARDLARPARAASTATAPAGPRSRARRDLRRRRPASRSGSAGGSGSRRGGSIEVRRRAGDRVQLRRRQRDRRAQQLARVRMRGLGEHLARRALLDDLAGVHDGHPVARLGDDAEVVRDQQERRVEVALQVGEDARGSAPRRSRRATVVGSSATSSFGRSTSASAIMMRWRMPPENSCGYWRKRVGGMPIRPSVSSERRRTSRVGQAAARAARASRGSARAIRSSGLSRVIGSWKIRPSSGPRSRRSSPGDSPTRFRPS